MNRRSGPWIVRILFAVSLVAALFVPQAPLAAAPPVDPGAAPTSVPADEIVVDEANPFLPEDRNLTECIGTLQRPGCGSEARGGWHQNAVAIVMIAGLFVVFGRIAWGVRRSQKQTTASSAD